MLRQDLCLRFAARNYDIKVPREQTASRFHSHSRGTLMSYGDQFAQRSMHLNGVAFWVTACVDAMLGGSRLDSASGFKAAFDFFTLVFGKIIMVGRSCCIQSCSSKSHSRSGIKLNNGLRFFAFPKCKKREGKHVEEVTRRRRMTWIAAARRKNITFNSISKSMRVCSLHFHSGQPSYEMYDTHPDWAPSLLLGHNEVKVTDENRFARRLRRHDVCGVRAGQKVESWVQSETKEMTLEQQEEICMDEIMEVKLEDIEEMGQQEVEHVKLEEIEEVRLEEMDEMRQHEMQHIEQLKQEEIEEMIQQEMVEVKLEEVEEERQQDVKREETEEVVSQLLPLGTEVKCYLEGEQDHENTMRRGKQRKRAVRRSSKKFTVQDGHRYYTEEGSKRLVIMDEKEKERVLLECHENPETGRHRGSSSTYNKIVASYYWLGIMEDIKQWIDHCPQCRHSAKTTAPELQPISVTEPWTTVLMDLMGPLPVTLRGNSYVLVMTDLFTRWLISEPLKSKTATEVSAVVLDKLFEFGVAERILTRQGTEFVNQVNEEMFHVLGLRQCVASDSHSQLKGHDMRTSQTITRTLFKYCNEQRNDWDKHLKGVVYAINTSKHAATNYTPYFLMFNRHPRMVEVLNIELESQADSFAVENPEVGIDGRIAEVTAQCSENKGMDNIEKARQKQMTSYEFCKWKEAFHVSDGEEVLNTRRQEEVCKRGRLESNCSGSFVVSDITEKGLVDKSDNCSCQITEVLSPNPLSMSDGHLQVYTGDHEYCRKTGTVDSEHG